MNDNMGKNVTEMLKLLDEMPKIKASPGFFQRTKYRLDHLEEDDRESLLTKILKHALTPALVGASIAIGIFIGMGSSTNDTTSGVDAIVEAYNMEISETQTIINLE